MEKLVYVRPVGKGMVHGYEYELYYSETPDIVWGIDWEYENPSACDILEPEPSNISSREKVRTTIPYKTAIENSCYSMEYCTYDIIALAWIDIDNLDEYPEKAVVSFISGWKKKRSKNYLNLILFKHSSFFRTISAVFFPLLPDLYLRPCSS